ncbi:MAG: DUF1573 domain-containing protein [Desulfatibacillum sp.]|nr:DUF1573 domain-containing protein [Desulfatibacillum sp.]
MEVKSVLTRVLFSGALLLSVCMAPAMAGDISNPREGLPTIVFDATNFAFESVMDGDLVTHQYTFKNTGAHDLEIKQIKTS